MKPQPRWKTASAAAAAFKEYLLLSVHGDDEDEAKDEGDYVAYMVLCRKFYVRLFFFVSSLYTRRRKDSLPIHMGV